MPDFAYFQHYFCNLHDICKYENVNMRIVNFLYEFHVIHNLFLEMQEHWKTFQSVELKINDISARGIMIIIDGIE